MTKRATHTRSGGIADFASAVYPSVFIFQFGQAVCLRHCAAYERVKHHETEFSHVLARKCPVCRGIGGGAEKCSVEAGSTQPLHPVQKSEILILSQLNERFLKTSGRLLCVGGHEQVSPVETCHLQIQQHGRSTAPVFTNHIIIIRSKKVRSPEEEGGGPGQV